MEPTGSPIGVAGSPVTRRAVSLLVLAAGLVALLLLAADVLLIIFAGLLFAVFLRGGGVWISGKIHLAPAWGVAMFMVALLAAFAAFAAAVAPTVSTQIDELGRRIPEALETLRDRIEAFSWGPALLDRLSPSSLGSSGAGDTAASAVTTTFGALGNAALIFFIGLYGAFSPEVYRRGVILLLAPSLRQQTDDVFDDVTKTLQNWLTAQLIAMTVVGLLTAAGLWAAGIPLAFGLGLIAGLLAFIPNIGPILAIAPALLLAAAQGQTAILLVLAIYIGVQTLESYAVTPLVQQEKVDLAPAFVIAAQLLMGALFGLLGLALATPVAAALMTLTKRIYVRQYLEREPPST
ncbi:AI-2E family transporter [Aquabacter spiritensis]|uniref:Putative PurR-regulated permease PerM n=1 Tax=Aquabacter spiritensis TaxID=933073 RepID=A0A4R3M9B9_9HYPH|nr:AI-2E family transporter [Aquabacter spiritensis]TCT08307.1 putative PurR-regulated permease PerM [Aquabacter spiritensis]